MEMNGIYIHIPFCVRKCRYCDFTSYTGMEQIADKYIDALEREIIKHEGITADTLFIGGGTPSLLQKRQIERVAMMCFKYFDIQKDYEFSIEANPGTLGEEKINAMLESGINRISIGVQSFDDRELKAIGRIHDAKTAYDTVTMAHRRGFLNINIDLMTALPYQSMQTLKHSLSTAVSLPVKHISAYSLIVEEGTPIASDIEKGILALPDDGTDREMYRFATEYLAKNGFSRYEISNFAKKGYECRHNIKYWTMRPYIGIGAAAHSFDGRGRRGNTAGINEYIEGKIGETSPLTDEDIISEFMITGLRMSEGISAESFLKLTGKRIEDVFANELYKHITLGLIEKNDDRYRLTERGIDVSNWVLCDFVAPSI